MQVSHHILGIVHPKTKICWKCTHPQAIQNVDEFVSLSEQIWRNLVLLTSGSYAVNGSKHCQWILMREDNKRWTFPWRKCWVVDLYFDQKWQFKVKKKTLMFFVFFTSHKLLDLSHVDYLWTVVFLSAVWTLILTQIGPPKHQGAPLLSKMF